MAPTVKNTNLHIAPNWHSEPQLQGAEALTLAPALCYERTVSPCIVTTLGFGASPRRAMGSQVCICT